MGMPVKLSDDLVESARAAAANTDRSITGQIEHWAKIGRAVEIVLRHQDVQALKRSPPTSPLTGVARQAIQSALEKLATETDRRALERSLKSGRIVYQTDPGGSALTERIEPDGTRTLGRFENRRFVPVRHARSGRR